MTDGRPDEADTEAAMAAVSARAGRLLGRLRGWAPRSWALHGRVPAARAAAQSLANLARSAEDGTPVPVPPVGVWAVADQLTVLAVDAVAVGVPIEQVGAVLDELALALGLAEPR